MPADVQKIQIALPNISLADIAQDVANAVNTLVQAGLSLNPAGFQGNTAGNHVPIVERTRLGVSKRSVPDEFGEKEMPEGKSKYVLRGGSKRVRRSNKPDHGTCNEQI